MLIISKPPNDERSFNKFTATTVSIATCKGAKLRPTQNKDKILSSTFSRKKNAWLQKRKRPHQKWESVSGTVTKKLPKVTKP